MTIHLPRLDDLEGATLDDVTVDWRNGIVLVTFLPPTAQGDALAVRALDFTHIEIVRGGVGPASVVKSASRKGDTTEIVVETGALRVAAPSVTIDILG